jgi:hypothetical protein
MATTTVAHHRARGVVTVLPLMRERQLVLGGRTNLMPVTPVQRTSNTRTAMARTYDTDHHKNHVECETVTEQCRPGGGPL